MIAEINNVYRASRYQNISELLSRSNNITRRQAGKQISRQTIIIHNNNNNNNYAYGRFSHTVVRPWLVYQHCLLRKLVRQRPAFQVAPVVGVNF